jgi:hypothetical protein
LLSWRVMVLFRRRRIPNHIINRDIRDGLLRPSGPRAFPGKQSIERKSLLIQPRQERSF